MTHRQTAVDVEGIEPKDYVPLPKARPAELKGTNKTPIPSAPRHTMTVLSEHGHDLSNIAPMTHHPAESVSAWFAGLFTTVIAISTLGASITFNFVIGNNNTPVKDSYFDVGAVQLFLGISWLLFLLALASASMGSTILTFFKHHWKKDWDGEHGRTSQREVQLYATFTTAILAGLVVAAFIFLCLVVTAYLPVVGWASVGFTSAFGLMCAIGVMYQVPWPWQTNQPKHAATD